MQIHFKIPVSNTISPVQKLSEGEKPARRIETYSVYKIATSYRFTLQRISRGSSEYRIQHLTDVLYCEKLQETGIGKLFVKLTFLQRVSMNYHFKKYIWQSYEFQNKIYTEVAKYITIGLLAFIGALLGSRLAETKKWDLKNIQTTETIKNKKPIKNDSKSKLNATTQINQKENAVNHTQP